MFMSILKYHQLIKVWITRLAKDSRWIPMRWEAGYVAVEMPIIMITYAGPRLRWSSESTTLYCVSGKNSLGGFPTALPQHVCVTVCEHENLKERQKLLSLLRGIEEWILFSPSALGLMTPARVRNWDGEKVQRVLFGWDEKSPVKCCRFPYISTTPSLSPSLCFSLFDMNFLVLWWEFA